MEQLSYQTLRNLGYSGYLLEKAPEKVMQFGEGNFLRAFADYFFDVANEKAGWNGKCIVIKPRSSGSSVWKNLNVQQGLYTLYLRGSENGEKIDRKRVISSISRCVSPYEPDGFQAMMESAVSDDLQIIVSNTTEAGIVYDPACQLSDTPCESFPGKLTQVLYARYKAGKPGVVVLSCELIDNNGKELKKCVSAYREQWSLEPEFEAYLDSACTFCSTLVDRIVPGAPRDPQALHLLDEANGFRDAVPDVGEVFGVWNIEGPQWLEERLPFRRAGLNCTVVPDVTPYKKRKVRILNGAHTGFVPGAYLAGFEIVRDCMENSTVLGFMNKMLREEVLPTLPMDKKDLEAFTAAVQDRFNNPFVDHQLMSISLNSTSKWKARNLPSLLDYQQKFHALPRCLAMSFACYLAFYSSQVQELTEKGLVCRRPDGKTYLCSDDPAVLEFYYVHRNDAPGELAHTVMVRTDLWGRDLTEIPGFEALTVKNLTLIREHGTLSAFRSCL